MISIRNSIRTCLAIVVSQVFFALAFGAPASSPASSSAARQGEKRAEEKAKTADDAKTGNADQAPLLPVSVPNYRNDPAAKGYGGVCPTVRLENRDEFDFTAMETRLICGDGKNDHIGTPWATIPPNEAAYFLRSFLQSRGYHQAQFIQDGELLFVKTGPLSRLHKFTLRGGPPTWQPPTRRLVRGLPMTPSLLDDLQGWALGQIKDEGYACAEAATQADPLTQEAAVFLEPGEIKTIAGFEDTGDAGLREGVLNRYNAFRVGDLYREYLVTLTRRRTQEDGFLQTLVLTTKCEPGPTVKIQRDVVLGPSRMVRLGVGASTDRGARFRGIIQQNRIGSYASSAQARINLSYLNANNNQQIIDASFRWYYSDGENRSNLQPRIILEHNKTGRDDETQLIDLKLMHAWNKEYLDGQLEVEVGPSYLSGFEPRREGPGKFNILYGDARARYTTHQFEYWGTSPRRGGYIEGRALATQEDFASTFTAQRLELRGHKLWDIFRYDPPLLILATRWEASSVFSPQGNGVINSLPLPFLTFLGGEGDLRGFTRRSLPREEGGALSGLTGSFEARLHKIIFRQADLFAFWDAGLLGNEAFALEKPIFMSPGAGVRWESPFGVLRVYGAQRFAMNVPENTSPYPRQWRLVFTFGEEF